ncbi:MAG: hypothetical protein M5R42_03020 [Rhodocyclaceae bacterium]|nr:hypothetical protein [Rhodocyclaceae bacterium]
MAFGSLNRRRTCANGASREAFLDDDAAHGFDACDLGIRVVRVERMQAPASVAQLQLAEGELLIEHGDDVAAVACQAFRLDDDDLALGEFRQHAVAQHHQGVGLGVLARRLCRILCGRGGQDGNDPALCRHGHE